jgi:hypothetical protein
MLLFGGRTGDLYGKRRMFMIGIALFATASLVGGFAQDQAWLITTRGLQGIGGAVASPTALSLMATNFPRAGSATGRWAFTPRCPARAELSAFPCSGPSPRLAPATADTEGVGEPVAGRVSRQR